VYVLFALTPKSQAVSIRMFDPKVLRTRPRTRLRFPPVFAFAFFSSVAFTVIDAAPPAVASPLQDVEVTPGADFAISLPPLLDVFSDADSAEVLSVPRWTLDELPIFPEFSSLWAVPLITTVSALTLTLGNTCGASAAAVVMASSGLYAVGIEGNEFITYDLVRSNRIRRANMGSAGAAVALSHDEKTAFGVAESSLQRFALDASFVAVRADAITIPAGSAAAAFSRDDSRLFVVNPSTGYVQSFDATSLAASAPTAPCPGCVDLAVSRVSNDVFIAAGTSGICRFDAANPAVLVLDRCFSSLGGNNNSDIQRLVVGANSRTLFALDSANSRVLAFSQPQNSTSSSAPSLSGVYDASNTPASIAVNDAGNIVLVGGADGSVEVADFSDIQRPRSVASATLANSRPCSSTGLSARGTAAMCAGAGGGQLFELSNPVFTLQGRLPAAVVAAAGGVNLTMRVTDGSAEASTSFRLGPVPGWTTGTTGTTGSTTGTTATTTGTTGSTTGSDSLVIASTAGVAVSPSSSESAGGSRSVDAYLVIVLAAAAAGICLLVAGVVVFLFIRKRRRRPGVPSSTASSESPAVSAAGTPIYHAVGDVPGIDSATPVYNTIDSALAGSDSEGEPVYNTFEAGSTAEDTYNTFASDS
jgi:hypothetical protein